MTKWLTHIGELPLSTGPFCQESGIFGSAHGQSQDPLSMPYHYIYLLRARQKASEGLQFSQELKLKKVCEHV